MLHKTQTTGSGENDFSKVFSSPEPKAHGDLIGWHSIRPSVRPSMRACVHIFKDILL